MMSVVSGDLDLYDLHFHWNKGQRVEQEVCRDIQAPPRRDARFPVQNPRKYIKELDRLIYF